MLNVTRCANGSGTSFTKRILHAQRDGVCERFPGRRLQIGFCMLANQNPEEELFRPRFLDTDSLLPLGGYITARLGDLGFYRFRNVI